MSKKLLVSIFNFNIYMYIIKKSAIRLYFFLFFYLLPSRSRINIPRSFDTNLSWIFLHEQGWVSQTEPRGTTESSTFGEQQFNNWPRTFDQTESFGGIGTGEWCFLQSSTAATNPSLCDGTTSGARGLEASAEKLLRKSNGWKRLPRAKKRRWSERSNDHWFHDFSFRWSSRSVPSDLCLEILQCHREINFTSQSIF